jgi:hypothetical protein
MKAAMNNEEAFKLEQIKAKQKIQSAAATKEFEKQSNFNF